MAHLLRKYVSCESFAVRLYPSNILDLLKIGAVAKAVVNCALTIIVRNRIKLDSCTGLGRAGGHRVLDSIDRGEAEHQRHLYAVRARLYIIDTMDSGILSYIIS